MNPGVGARHKAKIESIRPGDGFHREGEAMIKVGSTTDK